MLKGIVVITDTRCPNGCTCPSSGLAALECVANRPIAHHVLDALLAAGVAEAVVAGTADGLVEMRRSMSRYRPSALRLSYVIAGDGANPVAALRAAAPLVGASPCVVHLGNGLLDEPLKPQLEAVQSGAADVVLFCGGSSAWPPLRSPDNGLHAALGPKHQEAGVAVFGQGILGAVSRLDGRAHSSSLEGAVRALSHEGPPIQVRETEGWRRYRGQPTDLLEINRLALDVLPAPSRPAHTNGRIVGKVQIDPTASVTTSLLIGPVVVGEGARVSNAYIGPYTSIGARARIDGAEIERSIIAPGATVMHVGARLVSSLVGRRAHVFRDFSLPRAMRLQVSEGDEVALC